MMKKVFAIVSMIVVALVSLQAQNANEAQIKQKITRASMQLSTMQCDFVQTKHLKLLNDEMVSRGKMYYQKSNKLRWEYTSPYQYTFILNDSKVLIKNQQRNDVIDVKQNALFREIARIMMNSVVGKSLSDDKDFKVEIADDAAEWVATLTPKQKHIRQMFQKIHLYFGKQTAMVTKIVLAENNGDKTVIKLTNVKTNGTLGKNIFDVD